MTHEPLKTLPIAEFEGETVRQFEGKLPALNLEMEEGYLRNTHLRLAVEIRVRNMTYREDKNGELVRVHHFALEEVQLTDAFDPAHRPTNVGGTAAADAWEEKFLDWVHGSDEPLDFDGEEIPDRLRELLKLWDDRVAGNVPTIKPDDWTGDEVTEFAVMPAPDIDPEVGF